MSSKGSSVEPVIKEKENLEGEEVLDGLYKSVLLGDVENTPNFNLRKFTLEPGKKVAKHTNKVEHEQYALKGEYIVGIGDEEFTVKEGDSIFIPGDTPHWYKNKSEQEIEFLCIIPKEEDEIEIIE